jgi:hypothetical protein
VAANGTLTYTSEANQHGVATITLQITDNGGTANGGVNQSATQQFTITVTPVNDAPVAAAKAFTAQANMLIGYTINLAANGSGDVTDADNNDAGFTTQDFTLTSVAPLSCAGCVATITDGNLGTFTFEPPPGQTGTFTLTYRVTDNGNPPPGVQSVPGAVTGQPGVITITVNGPAVWFVDSTAPAGGNGTWTGTNAKAFQTIAQADAVNLAGDRIFVINNNIASINYAGNLGLLAGERLIGQGVTGVSFDAVVLGVVPPAGTAARPGINGTRPTLQGTTTLADGVTVTGVNFAPIGVPAMSASALVATVPITIDMVNVTGGTSALSLTNVTASGSGAINVSNAIFTNTSAAEVLINQGNVPVTLASSVTISSNAGRSVDIQNRNGGTVTFNGPITDTSQGVFMNVNTGSTINFTGGLALTTGANPGFTATGGGTVSATQNNTTIVNTITSTTGTALNVANTTIGAAGLTFRSISTNGAVNGIVLNTTGSGALTVTGNSAGNCGGSITLNPVGTPATVGAPVTGDCTGGTIQATTGAGISLTNTTGTSLTRMRVLNSGTDGLLISNVNGFTLANSFVSDSSGVAGDRGIEMGDFSTGTPVNGTITISNSTLGPTPHDNVGVGIASGTSTWSITNTVFTGSVMNSGFNYEIRNATMTSFTIDESVFQNQFADGMQMQPASGVSATVSSATIQNSTFQSNNIGMDLNHDGTSNVTYRVLNNTFMNQVSNSINFFSSASVGTGGTLNGRFVGNAIGNAAVFNSGGGIGIRININGGADSTVLVDSNTIRQVPNGRGIEIISRNGTGGTDATVTNNFVNTDFVPTVANGGFSLSNIFLQSNCLAVCNTLRADVRSNTVPAVAPNGELFAAQIALIETGASTLQLVDTGTASASCTAQLTETNTGSAGANAGCSLIPGPIGVPPL